MKLKAVLAKRSSPMRSVNRPHQTTVKTNLYDCESSLRREKIDSEDTADSDSSDETEEPAFVSSQREDALSVLPQKEAFDGADAPMPPQAERSSAKRVSWSDVEIWTYRDAALGDRDASVSTDETKLGWQVIERTVMELGIHESYTRSKNSTGSPWSRLRLLLSVNSPKRVHRRKYM